MYTHTYIFKRIYSYIYVSAYIHTSINESKYIFTSQVRLMALFNTRTHQAQQDFFSRCSQDFFVPLSPEPILPCFPAIYALSVGIVKIRMLFVNI